MGSNTRQLLRDYHDASKRLEAIDADKVPLSEKQEYFVQRVRAARELISRCIISDDPWSLCFLIKELVVLTKVLGQPSVAADLNRACVDLADHLREFGTF